MPTHTCGLDFGTSNSALAVVVEREPALLDLEHGEPSIPTAIFFDAEADLTSFGRHAIRSYVGGTEGRLLRGLKSILGSTLIDETTLVQGRAITYRQIITLFLRHLKRVAENDMNEPLDAVVMGRPVFFVDDDSARDARAQQTLSDCARDAGFGEVRFELEPIAAALDYETTLAREEVALVVDIGGGTSDFSVVRLGPERARKADRGGDVLANLGVHLGGTDFDRLLSVRSVMPLLGHGAAGRGELEIPQWVYFDLATWHLINLLHTTRRIEEIKAMRHFFDDTRYHDRLLRVVTKRLGHILLGRVEDAKVGASSSGARQTVALDDVEAGLGAVIEPETMDAALAAALDTIVHTALRAVAAAGLAPARITALYFTGGSTALPALRARFAAAFPESRLVFGDPLGSVARGLALSASR